MSSPCASLTGTVVMASDPDAIGFQMDFPVEAMSVDEPQLRAELGADFETTVDEAAIAGTRDHMLGSALLNSKQYPQIHLQSLQIRIADGVLQATTRIQVRDTTAQAQIPVTLQYSGDDLTVSGEFDLTHSQLGLTPYSVALGALRVAERLHVQYRLHRASTALVVGLQQQQRRSRLRFDQAAVLLAIHATRQMRSTARCPAHADEASSPASHAHSNTSSGASNVRR
jgi:hypothetical protein